MRQIDRRLTHVKRRRALPLSALLSVVAPCLVAIGSDTRIEASLPDAVLLESKLDRLSRAVLGDPLDSESARELEGLRREQVQLRREGLNGLVEGLTGYMSGGRIGVAPGLEQARRSPDVVRLADWVLNPNAPSLPDIVKQVEGSGSAPLCATCGNTREADCDACNGAGLRPCRECRGRGIQVSNTGTTRRCPYCHGIGAIKCDACDGKGYVQCQDCDKSVIMNPVDTLDAQARVAIQRLIGMARYLSDGGIDVDSPAGRATVPTLP